MSGSVPRIVGTVRAVVELLVAGRYRDVASLSGNVRFTASEIGQAISDYGRKLVRPPDGAYDTIDVIEVANVKPRRWSVRFDLWTVEERRSDLTLELTLIDVEGEHSLLRTEVDNIHVL